MDIGQPRELWVWTTKFRAEETKSNCYSRPSTFNISMSATQSEHLIAIDIDWARRAIARVWVVGFKGEGWAYLVRPRRRRRARDPTKTDEDPTKTWTPGTWWRRRRPLSRRHQKAVLRWRRRAGQGRSGPGAGAGAVSADGDGFGWRWRRTASSVGGARAAVGFGCVCASSVGVRAARVAG